jgi:hypothetical protein
MAPKHKNTDVETGAPASKKSKGSLATFASISEAAEKADREQDPKITFGRPLIWGSKLHLALTQSVNDVPLHTYVNTQAAKLFATVNVNTFVVRDLAN